MGNELQFLTKLHYKSFPSFFFSTDYKSKTLYFRSCEFMSIGVTSIPAEHGHKKYV